MKNKEAINMLKDNAELAMAAYGYFHLADLNYKPDKYSKDEKRLGEFRKKIEYQTAFPTPSDILNIEYKKIFKGDFSPLQAQNFFEKYDLLILAKYRIRLFCYTLSK